MRIDPRARTKDTGALLRSLVAQLEKDKKAVKLGGDDGKYMQGFAEQVFAKADKQDRDGRADLTTAKTFKAASTFMEVLRQFGPLSPEIEQKRKYAVWKAADIFKAIGEGRRPVAGPPPPADGMDDATLLSELGLPPDTLAQPVQTPGGSLERAADTRAPDPNRAQPPTVDEPPATRPQAMLRPGTPPGGDDIDLPSAPTFARQSPSHAPLHPPPYGHNLQPPPGSMDHATQPSSQPQTSPSLAASSLHPSSYARPSSTVSPPPTSFYPPSGFPMGSYPSFAQSPHSPSPPPPSAFQPSAPGYPESASLSFSYLAQSPQGTSASQMSSSSPAEAPWHLRAATMPNTAARVTAGATMHANGGTGGLPPIAAYDSSYQPPPEKVVDAHKAARFAVSALAFDDIPTAVAYLQQSLELLTRPT
eukprot:SM000194S04815  [mRNA]  locus=s194:84961:86848:- [translate_table: standard]